MERDRLTPPEMEFDESVAAAMDESIIAALNDFPTTPLPAGFMRATMKQIASPPHFQLQFLDLALPFLSGVLFLTLLAGLGWLSGLLTPSWLPAPAEFSPDFLGTLVQLPLTFLVFITIAVVAALAMVVTVYVVLWLDRPLVFSSPH